MFSILPLRLGEQAVVAAAAAVPQLVAAVVVLICPRSLSHFL